MHEQPSIPEEQLKICLKEQYGILHVTLDFLPLGLDYNAGVYRVVDECGTLYLLKVKSGSLYESSYLVPDYLRNQGILAAVSPILTKKNTLWTQFEGWTVIVYPFIEGDTSWTGMTDEQWKDVGITFKRIHHVPPPSSVFESLRKETFDPAEYVRWIRVFEIKYAHLQYGESVSERALYSSWMEYQSTINMVVTSLEKLAKILQKRAFPHVLCHADLHPANLLRNKDGHVFVIDWDEVMLAPKERDFIYIREPQADAFFQGYGKTEIDWMALTYYLWERVAQDVISYAQQVCLKDDLKEETKAITVRLFHKNLAKEDNNTIAAAFAAEEKLNSES